MKIQYRPFLNPVWILVIFLATGIVMARETSILIHNAKIIDGTGRPAFIGSVRISEGFIAGIGELSPEPGEIVIDGTGQILAPGFIDTHGHYDFDPDATKLAAISQGITTIIIGQDGDSNYPLADFYEKLRTEPIATNIASYAGHGTIRLAVMNDDYRRNATEVEIDEMRKLLRIELASGAIGLSTGLEYDPGIYSTTEEIIALAKEAQAVGGRYHSHIRSEDRHLEAAIDEIIRIGKMAEIPVQVSHMKLARKSIWGKADHLLAKLDEARAAGVEITADIYPYEYWQTTMTVLFPERDFENRESAEYALSELVEPSEMILAKYDAEESYAGKTLEEVAKMRGEDAVTALIELIALSQEQKAEESVVARSMTEVDIQRILQWPHSNVCSDGAGAWAHPRGHGAFPRVLKRFVIDKGALSMEEAIRKMTSLSAEHVGLKGRGVLRTGDAADIVLLRPNDLSDKATLMNPYELSEGVSIVWVNGELVFENGKATGALPGQVLKRQDDR